MARTPTSSIEAFFFDPEGLAQRAERYRAQYRDAQPFPHVVIDDFLPSATIDRIAAEFPASDEEGWTKRQGYGWRDESTGEMRTDDYRVLGKLETRHSSDLPPHTRQLIAEMNSAAFLEFLESLTGIPRLLPDPHLVGAGLHSVARGGRLRVHADFVWNERIHLDRRLNLLIYLNRDWQESYGGFLELWDTEMSSARQRIAPLFNRCVIFTTTSTSFHGHPDPVRTPRGKRRNSLALYYYTAGRLADDVAPGHTEATLWKEPAGHRGSPWKRFVPPFAVDLARYLKWSMTADKLIPPAFFRLRRRG